MAMELGFSVNSSSSGIAANVSRAHLREVDGRASSRSLASTSGNVFAISIAPNGSMTFRDTSKFRNGRRIQASIVDGKIGGGYRKLLPVRSYMGMQGRQQSAKVEDSCAEPSPNLMLSRRSLVKSVILGAASLLLLEKDSSLLAAPLDSAYYREYVDRLDGYTFSYPSAWIQVKGAGADVFFRDPVNLDESVVVDFSSPSSSRYKSVKDLGTPLQAAEKVLKQKIIEFMSTRLGVRRESKIVSAKSRVGADGRLYYDIEVDVKSYANTNQLAVMPEDRVVNLEWSRRYLSTLGVENNRLYELKLQAPERVLASEGTGLRQIMKSFQLVKLEA